MFVTQKYQHNYTLLKIPSFEQNFANFRIQAPRDTMYVPKRVRKNPDAALYLKIY